MAGALAEAFFALAGALALLALGALVPLATAGVVDQWVERLTGYALSMVQGEIARRQATQRPARRTPTTSHKKESNA